MSPIVREWPMNHLKMFDLTDLSRDEGHDPVVVRIPGTQSCFLRCGVDLPTVFRTN